VLLAIAIPSFRLLYILDEVTLPTITVKVTGLLKDGPKSYIINKIKNTNNTYYSEYLSNMELVKKMLYFYIRFAQLAKFPWIARIEKLTLSLPINHSHPLWCILPCSAGHQCRRSQRECLAMPLPPSCFALCAGGGLLGLAWG
jgi:hypothetical protein